MHLRDDVCARDLCTDTGVLAADKGFIEEYMKFVNYTVSQGTDAQKFQVGSNRQFTMVNDPKKYAKLFEIRNLCANGEVWAGKGKKSVKMYSGDPLLFDENMNSCAIRLRYGKFSYYNGGDYAAYIPH